MSRQTEADEEAARRLKAIMDAALEDLKDKAERLLEEVDYDIRKERGWAKTPEADKEHGLPDTFTERSQGPDPYEPEDVGQGEDDYPG